MVLTDPIGMVRRSRPDEASTWVRLPSPEFGTQTMPSATLGASGRAPSLTVKFGRRTILLAGIVLMVLGLALTLTQILLLILAGLLLFTGGFFAAHSIGAGWTGGIATTGRAQAASLYNLAYYLGSSAIGWAGGLVFQSLGWTALALTVIGLGCRRAVTPAFVLPASGARQGEPGS